MSQYTENGKTIVTAEAVAAYRLLRSDGYYADAGDTPFGATGVAAASGDAVALKLKNDGGTIKLEAAAAIASGRTVYTAADGKVSATPIGKPFGFALEAATAAGDIIEVFPAEIPYDFTGKKFEAVADNLTLDIQDVGKVLYVTADAKTITLPAVAAGLDYVIMNGSSALGAIAVTVSPNSNDKIMGADLAGVDNKDRINTKATAVPGDYIHIAYGSADGWLVLEEKGTWAAES